MSNKIYETQKIFRSESQKQVEKEEGLITHNVVDIQKDI